MRYIKKKRREPNSLSTYKEAQRDANLSVSYNTFREKRGLNDVLRIEQFHICCYCQQKLSHYQGPKIGGSHNEHLIPQCSDVGDGSIGLNYYNIYACCIDSQGMSELHEHCGESKHNKNIRGFIQAPDCTAFFKYNVNGEILPNGEYDDWNNYVKNAERLTDNVKAAYEEIKILNLNCNKLVNDRKNDFDMLLKWLLQSSKNDVEQKIISIESAEYFERYIDMLLYYMRKKKN